MYSYHSDSQLKESIISQMEQHLADARLQPVIIGENHLNIYGDYKDSSIDYPSCEKLLGLPLSFLMLTLQETDWCCYNDHEEGARDTIKETLDLFKAIPIGQDLRGFAPAYFEWLLHEETFGAGKYKAELDALLPATLACVTSGRADHELREKAHQFALDAKQRYVTIHKQDMNAAVRWWRAGKIASFLGLLQLFLIDGTSISQDTVEDFFWAGLRNNDDRPTHEVINMMHEKLRELLGAPTVWLGLISPP